MGHRLLILLLDQLEYNVSLGTGWLCFDEVRKKGVILHIGPQCRMSIKEGSSIGVGTRLAASRTEVKWAVTAEQFWGEHFRPDTYRARRK